jgi:hypothetical protein
MKSGMVRKQLYLSVEQNEELRRRAARQRCTEAEIVREAVTRYFGLRDKKAAAVERDPLWSIIGAGVSDQGDLSEHVDDILYGKGGA